MTLAQYIVIPVFIALQAFVMMVIAPFIPGGAALGAGLVTWIAFQAWAMYFLGGCKLEMALKTLLGYLGGIAASIAIFEVAKVLGFLSFESFPLGLYLAVFVVVIFVICAEKLPLFNFIPAWFIGAGVFFALMTHCQKPTDASDYAWYMQLAVPELIACAVGLAFGWGTVTFRSTYERRIAAQNAKKAS